MRTDKFLLRGYALLASCIVVTIACGLLFFSSITTLRGEAWRAARVKIESFPTEPHAPRVARRNPPTALSSRAPDASGNAPAPDADRTILAQMLACFDRLSQERERRRDCLGAGPPTAEWDSRAQLPIGGDFAEPAPLDLNEVYTPAQLASIVIPPCTGVCIRIGRKPPPPSRSAEEICEAGGIGPCHPPPFREAPPRAR